MSQPGASSSTALDRLEASLRQSGYSVERGQLRSLGQPDDARYAMLTVEWPAGKGVRRIVYDESDAVLFEGVPVDDFRMLDEYDALLNVKSGQIEARVGALSRVGLGTANRRALSELPGVEILSEDAGAELRGDPDELGYSKERPWRLRVSSGAMSLELSPASETFKVFFGMPERAGIATLKIMGSPAREHDVALATLESFGRAFLLDLELRYGAGYGLWERRPPARRPKAPPIDEPPSFPRNRYAPEPLALYTYGRSAAGLPLLEYLAYYQALEFFFPIITQEETVRAVGAALRNPRFNYADEASIRGLISLVTNGTRGRASEREQLRLTIRAVVDAATLHQFVESSPPVQEHLCAKAQIIKGVNRLLLTGQQADLRDQIADRIYAIRCRIVHTKDEGGESGIELLLPSSREARSLGPDVDLVRMIAEHALVSRATPLLP